MIRLLLSAGLLLAATPALAGDCVVITGATVHGSEAAAVVIDDGRIASPDGVGAAKAGTIGWGDRTCAHVDGTGKHVSPGLIDTITSLGLIEVSLEGGSHNIDAGGDPVRASHRVVDSYNPRSSVVPITRIEGTTTALVHPRGGLIAGKVGAVQLAGGTQREAVADPFVGLPVNLNARPSRAATLDWLGELFDDARGKGFDRRTQNHPDASERDLQALQSVLQGKKPLIIAADRAADLEAIVRFAAQERVRVIINGGAEGWLVADLLADAGIPVIVHGYVYGPGSFDQIQARPDNPRLLAEAGVDVLVASRSGHFARGLRQITGNVVREGLPHAAGLAAITSTPARVFGLVDRGALTPGLRADVVLWSGDPLEVTTSVEALWIGGRSIPLESRQTKLLERYRTTPGTPLAPLPLPK